MGICSKNLIQLFIKTEVPVDCNRKLSCVEKTLFSEETDPRSELLRVDKMNSIFFVFKINFFIAKYSSIFRKIFLTVPC